MPHPPDFDVSRYVGIWYEFRREGDFAAAKGICSSALYKALPNGDIDLINCELRPADQSHKDPYWHTKGGVASNNYWNPGQLRIAWSDLPIYAPYNVVATDYESYSILYSCTFILPNAVALGELLWVLTRE